MNGTSTLFVILAFALAAFGQPVFSARAAPPVTLGQPTASLGATGSGSVRVARTTFHSTSRKTKDLVAIARKAGRQLTDLSRCAETDCRLIRLHRVCSTLDDLSDTASLAEDVIGTRASTNAAEASANCDLAADALRRERHPEAARHVVMMNTRIGDAAKDIAAVLARVLDVRRGS